MLQNDDVIFNYLQNLFYKGSVGRQLHNKANTEVHEILMLLKEKIIYLYNILSKVSLNTFNNKIIHYIIIYLITKIKLISYQKQVEL